MIQVARWSIAAASLSLLMAMGACADSDSGAIKSFAEPPADTDSKPDVPVPADKPEDTKDPVDANPQEDPELPADPKDPDPPKEDPDPVEDPVKQSCKDGYEYTHWHAPALRHSSFATEFPLDACAPDGVIAIIPRGTTWEFTVNNLSPGDEVRMYTAHFFTEERLQDYPVPQVTATADNAGRARFEYKALFGGEQTLVVYTKDEEATGSFKVSTVCVSNCNRVTTRFPVVLVHGFLGTQNYFGLFEYWYKIVEPLRDLGMEVYDPSSDLVASSQTRAIKVAQAMDDAMAETGARKVNLIGHSQGGTDSRIIASPNGLNRGANISSLTTIATPHYGVPIPLLDWISGAFNALFEFPNFSPEEAKAFNNTYIDDKDVEYYSWSFKTCASKDYICQISSGGIPGPSFDIFSGEVGFTVYGGEKVNALLEIPYLLIAAGSFLGGTGADNDGLVTVTSSKWGPKENQFGPLWADHVDEIGQIMRDPESEVFNQTEFYKDWVRQHLIPDGH